MGGKPSKADRNVHETLPDTNPRRANRRAAKEPVIASRKGHHQQQRPWSPTTPNSPHSTNFTVSTDNNSVSAPTSRSNHHNINNAMADDLRYQQRPSNNGGYNGSSHHAHQQYQRPQEKDRRMIEAEKILEEIAKEYAAKRAAGLVPTKPVPARTLLWEEMAKNRVQSGRRGQCIFGRDTDKICGCTSYKKLRLPGHENPGGVCECCNHGSSWHRLVGGTMARSSRMSRSILAGSTRVSRVETASSYVPSEARSSSMYDYDSDEDYDDDEDEDAIANEMAVPSTYHHQYDAALAAPPPPPPAMYQPLPPGHFGVQQDRLSSLSLGSSFGFTSRHSSGTSSLGALLQSIQRYRAMGLDEDEIEARIRDDFPPVPRKSSVAARSDVSRQSQVDI